MSLLKNERKLRFSKGLSAMRGQLLALNVRAETASLMRQRGLIGLVRITNLLLSCANTITRFLEMQSYVNAQILGARLYLHLSILLSS